MIVRLVVAAALIGAFMLALSAARALLRRRDRRIIARLRAADAAPGVDAQASHASFAPRIVYFTTRTCVVCRAQQEPALERLSARVPDLRLERHDAVDETALADEYGVLSVPTTAVYDRAGGLVTINRGFAPAAVLLAQIENREPTMDGGFSIASESVAG